MDNEIYDTGFNDWVNGDEPNPPFGTPESNEYRSYEAGYLDAMNGLSRRSWNDG